ncbi:MAG: O-antigen ligase family protein [Deltaproteobacteria bacterium]|nr:O-antigen ligase family protein [Deltaproteobacteria bacterium]
MEGAFVLFLYSGRFKTIPQLQVIPADVTVLLLLMTALGTVYLILTRKARLPPINAISVLMLLFTEFAIASVFWSSLAEVNIESVSRFTFLTSTSFFVASILSQDSERRQRVVRLIALVSFGILLYYLYQRFVVGISSDPQSGWFDSTANGVTYMEYGDQTCLLFIICLALAVFGSWTQWWCGSVGLCATASMLTIIGGRGSLVFAILSIPLLVLCLLVRRARTPGHLGRLLALLTVLCCFGVVGYATLVSGSDLEKSEFSTLQRMDTQLSGEDTHSMDGRVRGRAKAFSEWLQRPLTGWGIAEFEVQDSYLRYPHQLLLQVLMETGIIGAVLFFGAVAKAVFVCLQIFRDGLASWVDAALVLIFLTDVALNLTVEGNLAEDRIFLGYLGVIVGYACTIGRGEQLGRHQRLVGPMSSRLGLPIGGR